jgi:hypothetical protein
MTLQLDVAFWGMWAHLFHRAQLLLLPLRFESNFSRPNWRMNFCTSSALQRVHVPPLVIVKDRASAVYSGREKFAFPVRHARA